MIAASPRRPSHFRPGFTLLEVLVVVAILVILASVASIAVFSFLDDARQQRATLDMQALESAYKAISITNSGETTSENFSLDMLIPRITQGSQGLIDPWGQQYQFRFIQSGETGEERIQFYTYDKKTGNEIVWPRR